MKHEWANKWVNFYSGIRYRYILLYILLLLVGCRTKTAEKEIVIISTNDIHGYIDRFPKLATFVERVKAEHPNVILVDAGDRFTVTIPADEAYGEHLEELLMEVPVSEVPEDIKPEVGMMLQIATDDGDMEVQIVEVNDKVVVLDANHPLAGEDLTFDIEVIDVK